jgi:methanogenic corrinoid protein MtbC1
MVPLLAAGLITSGLSGLAKTILGADQIADGREALRNAVRPEYQIQDEYYDNVGMANNMAQSGLPAATRDFYSTQSERGLTASTDAVLRGGGGINAIADIYDKYNQANMRVASEDAMMRTANIRNLMEQNRTLAGQKNIKWSIDEYEPYKDTVRAGNQAVATGTNNVFTGLSGMASTLANAAIATSQQDNGVTDSLSRGGGVVSTAASGPGKYVDTAINPASPPANDPALQGYIENLLNFRTNSFVLS